MMWARRARRWVTVPGAGIAGGVGYLLYDAFTTDRAAGAVNGTAAEPGPGTRTVTDTNSVLSISGGKLSFATGGVTNGNPGLYYDARARQAGRLMVATINVSASTLAIGFDENTASTITDALRLQSSGTVLGIRDNTVTIAVGTFATSTDYQIAVAMRATGAAFAIKGGAFTTWTLVYISRTSSASSIVPAIVVESSSAVGTVDNVIVPTLKWLPTPLVSDGFSSATTADGLGHAEGIAVGLGSGGDGASWAGATATLSGGKMRHVVGLGSELLTNVEFTTDVSGWSLLTGVTATRRDFAVSPNIAPTGGNDDFGIEILTNGSGSAGIRQQPTIANHTWHQLSCMGYWPSSNTGVNLAQMLGVQPSTSLNIVGEDEWESLLMIARSTSTAGDVRFRNISGTSGDIAYFDAPSFKPLTLTDLFRTTSTGVASVFASVAVTLTTGTQAGLVLNLDSAGSPANFVIAYHDGVTCKLEKCVAGTYTSLISVTTTYVAGARIAVQRRGNAVRLYYNNALVGTEQTVSDAGIVSNTLHGTFSTYELNEFDDLVIYDSGVGGAYDAVLDAI